VLAGVAVAFFALPFLGLLWRAPWGQAWDILTQPSVRTALWLSITC
jgi:molybdate transport system permease protein